MSKRVYEIAKECKVTSKELLAVLQKEGVAASSHMSVLSDEEILKVQKALGKKVKATPVAKKASSAKTDKKATIKSGSSSTQNTAASKKVEASVQKRAIPKEKVVLEKKTQAPQGQIKSSANRPSTSGGASKKPFNSRQQSRRKPTFKRSHYKKDKRGRDEVQKEVTQILVKEAMPLFEVAEMMNKSSSELILPLLKQGTVANRNHILSVEAIKKLALQFGIDVSVPEKKKADDSAELERLEELEKVGVNRCPIVVVMGHVDHGKTTLLDYIRNMNVAAKEKGGITQHLSAYEVKSSKSKAVFLDTPGHEAFSYLRKRGASVTDIAILVVAADDGIMPQTEEAIKHAKEAGVTIIVAINKIDKVDNVALERVKSQLAQHELMPEDWGGKTVVVPVSAVTGQGVDELLEMITLQGELMELKALKDAPGKAFVLESHIEKGYGSVATMISVDGSLKIGDYFVCGAGTGRIKLLIDSYGKKVKEVGPATPAKIVGFDGAAEMGDWLHIVSQKDYLKARSGKNISLQQHSPQQDIASLVQQATTETESKDDNRFINIVLKTDTRGSREAIVSSLDKLMKAKRDIGCPITIVTSAIGDVSEGDIELAANTSSMILCFNVKVERNALSMAKEKDVEVKDYQIIYKLIEDLEALLEKKRVKKSSWKKSGEAVVRKVFDIKGSGIIAGCYLREGVCSRNNKVVCMRNGKKIGEAKIVSLQRERKTVKEVHAGYEFGFIADSFQDWQIDDTVECLAELKE